MNIITRSIINSYSYEQANKHKRYINKTERQRTSPKDQNVRLRGLYISMISESEIIYGESHSWGYNKTNCICVPVEEEPDWTEAEQWIEKIVMQGKADFLRRTAFTERSEKLSLLKDIEEISRRKMKWNRNRNGRETETETETKSLKKNKQENGKRRRKATESEGEEEQKTTMQ
jgi:hypothetical protein